MKNKLLKLLWTVFRIPAQILLFRFKPKIIAITGSTGKTTTKDAIYWVLSKNKKIRKLGIRKNQGNLNTELGVPLTILGFSKAPVGIGWLGYIVLAYLKAIFTIIYPKILILEMAADKPGDIEYLISFCKPETSVITNVGPAHLEAFGTIQKIALEKAILLKDLESKNTAILNYDNEYTRKMGLETKASVVYFGKSSEANIFIDEIQQTKNGLSAKVHYSGSTAPIFMKSIGESIIYAALISIGVTCEVFNINLLEATKNLADFTPSKNRGGVFIGKKSCRIIDDTYNANPLSMHAAFDYLNIQARKDKKRIIIIGEMLELGDESAKYHQQVGREAGQKADYVLAVGKEADNYIKGAKQTIGNINNLKQFDTPTKAAEFILNIISKDDIILIKGSRGAKMERAVNVLLK